MRLKIGKFERKGLNVTCPLYFDGLIENLVVNMNETSAKYLTLDRIDAVVVGFLLFAMKNGYDIESSYPISKELFYALTTQFIPSMCAAKKVYHKVKIDAPLIDAPCDNSMRSVIGTGLSCGVDSLYTIYSDLNSEVPKGMNINTLFFFNVGAAMKGEKELRTDLVDGRLRQAVRFSTEYKYNFIFMESNIHLLIDKYADYSHVEQHTYMTCSVFILFRKG